MNSKRRRGLIGLFCALSLLGSGCGTSEEPTVEDAPPPEEPEPEEPEPQETEAEESEPEVSEPRELESVSLRTSWTMHPWWIPLIWAMENGYYEEEGIDLELLMGSGSGDVIPLVANESTDFAFIDLPTFLRFRTEGMPVKSVAVVLRQTDYGISCWTDAAVDDPEDLEGKSILITAGEAVHQVWPAFVGTTGIDESAVTLRFVDAGAKFAIFLDRGADCVAGPTTGSLLLLPMQADDPGVDPAISFADYGVSVVGNGVIAHEDMIAERPETVQAVVNATMRGFKEACANQEEAVDLYLEVTDEDDEPLSRVLMEPYCQRTQPVTAIDPGEAYGPSGEDLWRNSLDFLTDFAELQGAREPDYYYTDEFAESMPEL